MTNQDNYGFNEIIRLFEHSSRYEGANHIIRTFNSDSINLLPLISNFADSNRRRKSNGLILRQHTIEVSVLIALELLANSDIERKQFNFNEYPLQYVYVKGFKLKPNGREYCLRIVSNNNYTVRILDKDGVCINAIDMYSNYLEILLENLARKNSSIIMMPDYRVSKEQVIFGNIVISRGKDTVVHISENKLDNMLYAMMFKDYLEKKYPVNNIGYTDIHSMDISLRLFAELVFEGFITVEKASTLLRNGGMSSGVIEDVVIEEMHLKLSTIHVISKREDYYCVLYDKNKSVI